MKKGSIFFRVFMVVVFVSLAASGGGILNTESSIDGEKAKTLKVIKKKTEDAKKAIDEYKKVAAKKLGLVIARYWLQSRVKILSAKIHLDTQMTNRYMQNRKILLDQFMRAGTTR